MKHLTYILLALFATCAHAGDDWQQSERYWGLAAVTAETLAWSQQREIVIQHNRHIYSDFVGPVQHPLPVGRRESLTRVNAVAATEVLAGYFIADALPHDYRKAFLAAATVVEVSYVAHNYSIGVRTSF